MSSNEKEVSKKGCKRVSTGNATCLSSSTKSEQDRISFRKARQELPGLGELINEDVRAAGCVEGAAVQGNGCFGGYHTWVRGANHGGGVNRPGPETPPIS